jgi:signal transduction histidine kinase
VVQYDVEEGTAVLRAVNPAFERRFDVDGSAIADDRLADTLLVGTADGDSNSRWKLAEPADDTERIEDAGETDDTEEIDDTERRGDERGSDAETNAEEILARLTEGERVTVEYRPETGDERDYFRLEAVPCSDDAAEGYVVYTTVTELKRRMKRLRTRADRLERVASVTAHDLRNPLDVAKIRIEAARDTGENVHFEKVEEALERMQGIIQNVLSVGGGAVDPSDTVSLDDVAEAAWSTVETADATLALDADLSTIRADADRLQQIFENLFRNAVEHGRKDVTVTVGSLSDGFYVADDGSTIPSTERDHVFDPGYTTADDSTGLGLAIVRQIAEDHGWRVAVTASDAGGTRFAFTGVEAERGA